MIEVNKMRLIGDFLEINGDIVKLEMESKKNFINKIKFKRMRNRLIKNIKKLKKSNMILSKENLKELFYYIWNNYPPKGEYKYITSTIMNHEENFIESNIEYDDYKVSITIYEDEDDIEFNINSNNPNDKKKNISISRKNVSDDGEFKNIFIILNQKLLELISDYLLDIITKY